MSDPLPPLARQAALPDGAPAGPEASSRVVMFPRVTVLIPHGAPQRVVDLALAYWGHTVPGAGFTAWDHEARDIAQQHAIAPNFLAAHLAESGVEAYLPGFFCPSCGERCFVTHRSGPGSVPRTPREKPGAHHRCRACGERYPAPERRRARRGRTVEPAAERVERVEPLPEREAEHEPLPVSEPAPVREPVAPVVPDPSERRWVQPGDLASVAVGSVTFTAAIERWDDNEVLLRLPRPRARALPPAPGPAGAGPAPDA